MRYLFAIVVDAIIVISAYIGLVQLDQGMLNITHFLGWFCGVLMLLGFLNQTTRKTMSDKYKHQATWWRFYDAMTDLVFVIFCGYIGWFALATIYAIGAIAKAQFKSEWEKNLLTKETTLV